jgi:hypothetical protein
MEYDAILEIEWHNGAKVVIYGCPCGGCQNTVLKVRDESGAEVTLDLNPCEFGHLISGNLAYAEGMSPDGNCPTRSDG